MKNNERQKVWKDIIDMVDEFERRASVVFHYADQIGYPTSSIPGGSKGTKSDRVANMAVALAGGHSDDPAVFAARRLETCMTKLQNLLREMVLTIDSVEPQKPIPIHLQAVCMEVGCGVTRLQEPLIKGFCRKHYQKVRRS